MVGQLGASAKFKDGCNRLRTIALSRSSLCCGQSLLTPLSAYSAIKTVQRIPTSNISAITQQLHSIVVGMDAIKGSFNKASAGLVPASQKENTVGAIHMNGGISAPAVSSNNSPLSASVTGRVLSSAKIDGDVQVSDHERITKSSKSKHEFSTKESYGKATPFSSREHDTELGLFIEPAVGSSVANKMTINCQDDITCDADISTQFCNLFGHYGGLGESIAVSTMKAQSGKMSRISRFAKCHLTKRLLGDDEVNAVASGVSETIDVSCDDMEKAERCVSISLSQDSSSEIATKEGLLVVAEAIQLGDNIGFIGPLLPDAISATRDACFNAFAKKPQPLEEKAKRCVIIGLSQESSNGTATKEDSSVTAETVQSGENIGCIGPSLPDALSAARGMCVGASARISQHLQGECALSKKQRKNKAPKRQKNFCFTGLDSEEERSIDEIVRQIEGIGEAMKKCTNWKRKYNCKANTAEASERDKRRRKLRAGNEQSKNVEEGPPSASCTDERRSGYSDQRHTQTSNPYGSPMTFDVDDMGYATGNVEMSAASGDPDDANRNTSLASPCRAIDSKHKLIGNFPTNTSFGSRSGLKELNGRDGRPITSDFPALATPEEGDALLKDISFFYDPNEPTSNSHNCDMKDAIALAGSREQSEVITEEDGQSSEASPSTPNVTPKAEEESNENAGTSGRRGECCLTNRAVINLHMTAADASNATLVIIDRRHQFLVHQMTQMWDEFLTEGEPPTSYSTTANRVSDETATQRHDRDTANSNGDDSEPYDS